MATISTDETLPVSPIEEALGAVTDPSELSRLWENQLADEQDFMTQCVRRQGFSGYIEPLEPAPTPEQFAAAYNRNLIGIESEAYGISLSLRGSWETLQEQQDPEPNILAEYFASLPEEDEEALRFTVATCRAQARKLFVRPDPFPIVLADEIVELRTGALAASPEYVDALQRWAECMQAGGYEVSNREAAIELVDLEAESARAYLMRWLEAGRNPGPADNAEFEGLVGEVEAHEALVANHDLACALQVNEAEIRNAVLHQAEVEWLDANEDSIAFILAEDDS